jgi:SOS response regulatory protein OraA/RecX
MGRERLEAELIGQGLDRGTTERALEHAYGGRSERELALALLRQRRGARNPASRSREATLLRRYGFTEESIEAVLGNGAL